MTSVFHLYDKKTSISELERQANQQKPHHQQWTPHPGSGDAPVIIHPQPVYLNEPSLTAMQARQANLEELKKNDAYWEKRIIELEKSYQKMQYIMDSEYKKVVRFKCYHR